MLDTLCFLVMCGSAVLYFLTPALVRYLTGYDERTDDVSA